MKNKFQERFSFRRIIFLLLIIMASASAVPVHAQTNNSQTRKNIKMTNVTVQQLVDNLGADFKYSFFIVDEQVGKTTVSVDKKNATLREILDEAFRGKDIVYSVKDKNITISLKKNPPRSEKSGQIS